MDDCGDVKGWCREMSTLLVWLESRIPGGTHGGICCGRHKKSMTSFWTPRGASDAVSVVIHASSPFLFPTAYICGVGLLSKWYLVVWTQRRISAKAPQCNVGSVSFVVAIKSRNYTKEFAATLRPKANVPVKLRLIHRAHRDSILFVGTTFYRVCFFSNFGQAAVIFSGNYCG